MNKTQEALIMAIEVMEEGFGTLECEGMLPHRYQEAIKTCKEALAELALERMAQNAREIDLVYCKHGSDSACKECYMEKTK